MLSLTPLNGLHAAIKRRNSKARRDSISAPSNLKLPGAIRRFSSTETLSSSHLTSNVATVTRKSSFSRRIRKVSIAIPQPDIAADACNALDLHIAKIKRKLAKFREEDVEMSERVEELMHSVGDLCIGYHVPIHPAQSPFPSYPLMYSPTTPPATPPATPPTTPAPGDNYSNEDNDMGFLQFCQSHNHLMTSAPHPLHLQGSTTLPLRLGNYKERGTLAAERSLSYDERSLSYDERSQYDGGDHTTMYPNTFNYRRHHSLQTAYSFRNPRPPVQDFRNPGSPTKEAYSFRNSRPPAQKAHSFRNPRQQTHDFWNPQSPAQEVWNPQPHHEDVDYKPQTFTYQGREYQIKTTTFEESNYQPQPLSYQEISYDENDLEENSFDGDECWSEWSGL